MLVGEVSACLHLHAVHVDAEAHVQLAELQLPLDYLGIVSRLVEALELREGCARWGADDAEQFGVIDQFDGSGLDFPV